MKLLSDFDGVWTHPGEEARVQGRMLDEQLAALAPAEAREGAPAWIAAARRAVLAAPDRYGWVPGGRLTCFADEDPFAEHSALLHYLRVHAESDALARALHAAALARGHGSLDAFGASVHARAVAEVETTRGPGVLPEAAAAGRAMLAGGVEIVMASNSVVDKLERWFTGAGLPYATHPARVAGGLRLRGSARKFQLDEDASETLALGALRIETKRPHYEAILREERPDAVAGDLFSVDLALPLALRRGAAGWHAVRLFWIVQDYTPARMRREVERAAPEVECVEGGLAEVAARLRA